MHPHLKQRRSASPKLALSVSETARALGIGRTKLYALWKSGDGPPRARLGGRVVVRVSALTPYLRGREER